MWISGESDMNLQLLCLWHQWRQAIWTARRYAAKVGMDYVQESCLGGRDSVRGSVWLTKLAMQDVTAQVMMDYHSSREKHLRELFQLRGPSA